MKKIVCQACKGHSGYGGVWIVYGCMILCDDCRLRTINWFKDEGFGLGHPFVQEFLSVTR